MSLDPRLSLAATAARGLAMDAVHACSSGHLGLPLGAAEIGAALFGGGGLRFDPTDPRWLNRDRFILSAGHGSMFLYGWLHLAGFDVPLEQVRKFRALHSITPGHPEFHETPGVECTTGPLGQGVANAVGFALSGKLAAATYNTAAHTIFDHHVVVLAGDGCLQEGVAREAVAFAGHNQLDNLILIYDANDVTLDAMAKVTQSEDTRAVFTALGWDAIVIDGHDLNAVRTAVKLAKRNDNGRPTILICKTEIGRGIAEVAGTQKAHGEGGAKFIEAAKSKIGLPAGSHFFVHDEVRALFAERQVSQKKDRAAWEATYQAWRAANPALAAQLDAATKPASETSLLAAVPTFAPDGKSATRNSGGEIINALAAVDPAIVTGSADLFGSTKNYLRSKGDYAPSDQKGKNIWFGIREHAMGAISNGLAYDGLWRPSCATFLVFADYVRPSIRVAALSKLPVVYVFTHDSVGVGEDGPTHQPVETVSGLRLIPNLDVMRPADAEECAAAFAAAFARAGGPTLLALSRQDLPHLTAKGCVDGAARRAGTLRGGYILKRETAALEAIVLATGSEVQHAVDAATGKPGVRVVSVPCMERFLRQDQVYRDEVLPPTTKKRVAIEAGVTPLWWRFVGDAGVVLGIDRFGMSAPGNVVMAELGMTKEAVARALG